MADHLKFVALAQRLIAKQGRFVSLLRMGSGATDAAKPWNGTGAPAVELQLDGIAAVFLPATGSNLSTIVDNKDMLAQVTDVALVAPGDTDYTSMNAMLDGGKQFRIEWINVLKPADQIVLYAIGIKR